MSNFTSFLKKECLESIRTYKLMMLLLIFVIFGITNPLMAKLLPELLGGMVTDGISISMPPPTALDAWTQFFKNSTQIGLLVVVIVFSGVLATELSKGTLIIMLTKGLSRTAVILSKFTCMVLIWTLSIALCFGLTWGYTCYLFPDGTTQHLGFSVFCLWLFGVFLLAWLMFAATLTKNNYGAMLFTGAMVVVCALINFSAAMHAYNPLSLITDNVGLLTNASSVSSLYAAVAITAVLSLLLIAAAVLVFRKKQL